MSTAVQRRRGTTAQHTTFTGLNAEITVDTDKKVPVVHDGATAGGFPLLRENLSNVSTQLGFRNKIINGKMEISQRGTSFAAVASSAYSLDRWRVGFSTSAIVTISQQSDVPSNNEFLNSFCVDVTTADASIAAGDYFAIQQFIEGYNVRDLIGRTFTLSFWVRSSKTGIHCIGFSNVGADRSYITEYTVNIANTWEKKTVTVPNGLITTGTWDWTNGRGLAVQFVLASGTTFHTTAGAWQTGNFVATSNQVNVLDQINNIFAITGVQLEAGTAATPFEHRPYGTELALCQRYYYRTASGLALNWATGYNASTTQARFVLALPTTMRIAPTALEQNGTAAHYSIRHGAIATVCSAVPQHATATSSSAAFEFTVASGLTAGQGCIARSENTTAYLGWSAEL